MKSLLKNFSILFLGVALTLMSVYMLPSTIKSVTAQLSSNAMLPMQDITNTITQLPRYTRLRSSPTPYALPLVAIQSNYLPMTMDINGDGLLDIVYSTYNGNYGTQYVLLNNGQGFEIAYSCMKTAIYSGGLVAGYYYQGICADPNYPYTP